MKKATTQAKATTKTVVMTHKKSTKGTHVYEAESDLCTQVYFGKAALGEQAPATVTVTVEFEEAE